MSLVDKATQTEAQLHIALDEGIATDRASRDRNVASIRNIAEELAAFRAAFEEEIRKKNAKLYCPIVRTRRCEACSSTTTVRLDQVDFFCEACGYNPTTNSFR
jgi:ribosomal protein L37AE/L43A